MVIDWLQVLANAIWMLGLAILLSGFSYASYQAAGAKRSLRRQLQMPGFNLVSSLGLFLFCIGLAATDSQSWWKSVVWSLLALAFAWQAWVAVRQYRKL